MILFQIAAQPNGRHVVIDSSYPLVEAAEIDSITPAPPELQEGPKSTFGGAVGLEERILYETPSTPLHKHPVWGKPFKKPDEHQGQSIHRRKGRVVHVGERSVYGTEESHEELFSTPSEYLISSFAGLENGHMYPSQLPHTNEWSGDTLVASQAHHFIHARQGSETGYSDKALIVPRKRASPGRRSQGPLGLDLVFDQKIVGSDEDNQGNNNTYQYNRDPIIAEHNQDSAPSEQGSNLSSNTVLLKSPAERIFNAEPPQANPPRSPGSSPKLARSEDDKLTPQKHLSESSPTKSRAKKRIVTRKPWRSPCQEDFSPRSSPHKRIRRSLDASMFESQSSKAVNDPVRGGGLQEEKRRIRSRSLSRLGENRGQTSDAGTANKVYGPRHMAYTLGRASGQKIKPDYPKVAVLPVSRKRSRQSFTSISSPSSTSSDDGAPAEHRGSPIPRLPPSLHNSTPCIKISPTQSLPSDHIQKQPEQPEDACHAEDPGYAPSPDSDHSDTPIRPIPKKNRVATSPDISYRPWLRREIPSSKYFPEETGSPSGASPVRQPFWIKVQGKMIVCFPCNVKPGVYETIVLAKIHLSEQGENGWRNFKVPGLPLLDDRQPPGRVSFSLSAPIQYEIDRSLLEHSYACGPNLAIGTSRFGSSPLLHLRIEPQDNTLKEDSYSYKGNMAIPAQWYKVLEALSFEDGIPNNDVFLWLFTEMEKAISGRTTGDPFSTWFAQLHFDRLRSAMAAMLHQIDESNTRLPEEIHTMPKLKESNGPSDWTSSSNKVNRTDMAEEKDGLSSWANDKIRMPPAYFAGLFTIEDPLAFEDASKLAWKIELSVTRSLDRKLHCRLALKFLSRTPPLLIIDARDWLPDFAIINGKVATQMEWRETEDGDLALHHIRGLHAGKVVQIEMHFQELAVEEAFTSQGGKPRLELRLPNVVDKVILGGSLTCDVDNVFVTLTETNREDVTWRSDSLCGRNSVALPKLSHGYRMYLALQDRPEGKDDDLETLPDMDTVLDLATPSRQPSLAVIDQPIQSLTSSPSPSKQDGRILGPDHHHTVHKSTTTFSPPTASQITEKNTVRATTDSRVRPSAQQRRSRFSFGRLILSLVLAAFVLRAVKHLRDVVRDELMMHDNIQAEFEGWLHGLRFRDGSQATMARGMTEDGENGNQNISSVDEDVVEGTRGVGGNTTSVVEMRGEEGSGGEGERQTEREKERERIAKGASWRDMIDHVLGWRELEA